MVSFKYLLYAVLHIPKSHSKGFKKKNQEIYYANVWQLRISILFKFLKMILMGMPKALHRDTDPWLTQVCCADINMTNSNLKWQQEMSKGSSWTHAHTQTHPHTDVQYCIHIFRIIDRTYECMVIYCSGGPLWGGPLVDCHHFPMVKASIGKRRLNLF